MYTPATPDSAKLAEILLELRRLMDHSIRAIEEVDDKVELLLGVSIALLGTGLGITGGLLSGSFGVTGTPTTVALGLLFAGVGLNGTGSLLLLHGYVGLTPGTARRVRTGPDPQWLASVAEEVDWDIEAVRAALVKGYRHYLRTARAGLDHLGRLRRLALHAVLAGTAAYLAATLMMVGG